MRQPHACVHAYAYSYACGLVALRLFLGSALRTTAAAIFHRFGRFSAITTMSITATAAATVGLLLLLLFLPRSPGVTTAIGMSGTCGIIIVATSIGLLKSSSIIVITTIVSSSCSTDIIFTTTITTSISITSGVSISNPISSSNSSINTVTGLSSLTVTAARPIHLRVLLPSPVCLASAILLLVFSDRGVSGTRGRGVTVPVFSHRLLLLPFRRPTPSCLTIRLVLTLILITVRSSVRCLISVAAGYLGRVFATSSSRRLRVVAALAVTPVAPASGERGSGGG